MKFFESPRAVEEIKLVVFVPFGRGTPYHPDRPNHGLAFHLACRVRYSFDSGEDFICRAGDCIYLPEGASYRVTPLEAEREGAGVWAINFSLSEGEAAPPQRISPRATEELSQLYARSLRAFRSDSAAAFFDGMLSFYRIRKLLSLNASPEGSAARRKTLAPAIAYLEEHFCEDAPSIPALARLCGVSDSYFRKLFLKEFSVPCSVYLRNKRLDYAARLLESGVYSVTEVSLLCGFGDPAYFSREFKKRFAISPRAAKPH